MSYLRCFVVPLPTQQQLGTVSDERKRRSEQQMHEEKQQNNPDTEALSSESTEAFSGDSTEAFSGGEEKVEDSEDGFLWKDRSSLS